MRADEVVARARKCLGYGCVYRLRTDNDHHASGMHPNQPFPWDPRNAGPEADCSGYAMWCIGESRFYRGQVWFDTSEIVGDARSSDGILFYEVPTKEARPADLIVYPDYMEKDSRRQGHVGVITMVDSEGPLQVAHTSAGNWNRSRPQDAVQETGAGIWKLHPSIVARCKLVAT